MNSSTCGWIPVAICLTECGQTTELVPWFASTFIAIARLFNLLNQLNQLIISILFAYNWRTCWLIWCPYWQCVLTKYLSIERKWIDMKFFATFIKKILLTTHTAQGSQRSQNHQKTIHCSHELSRLIHCSSKLLLWIDQANVLLLFVFN